jgi:hypothetical protein
MMAIYASIRNVCSLCSNIHFKTHFISYAEIATRHTSSNLNLLLFYTEMFQLRLQPILSPSEFREVSDKVQTLAALMSSSATHSAIVLMFLKAASRAPVHSNQMAYDIKSFQF